MNVILGDSSLPCPARPRSFDRTCFNPAVLWVAALMGASPLLLAESHSSLQAVHPDGTSAWTPPFPLTIRGVLLCDPEEMLDSTPNFLPWSDGANQYRMGGEWQVTFQAVDPDDRGGTTCWMGQDYGNLPWLHDQALSYTDEAWVKEFLRLNHDPATGHKFQAGDLVEVTANRSLFYGGKRNINEAHDLEPDADFQIRLVEANHGLPAPEVITLAEVMGVGGVSDDWSTWVPIFDQTRATGGERYQGMRVRINDLTLLSTSGWNATNPWGRRLCTVTDGFGRFFSLRHPRYDLGPAPADPFDAIGIFTQESGSGSQGTNGYELFVQQILPDQATPELAIGLNVTISWPANSDLYRLEWRGEADTGEWTPVTTTPAVINGLNTVILPPASPQRFYQLTKVH